LLFIAFANKRAVLWYRETAPFGILVASKQMNSKKISKLKEKLN
jgi:hypothetical protein